MALLPSGSSEKEMITIVTPYFDFYLKGSEQQAPFCKEEDEALYEVRCVDEMQLHILEVVDTKACRAKVYGKPQLFEQRTYQLIIEKNRMCDEQIALEFDHDSPLIKRSITSLGSSGHLLVGMLNFGNEIGLTDLRILVNGKVYLTVTLEVYPTKLSYKKDYLQIREDIAKEIYNLSFDFLRRTYLNSGLTNSKKPSLTEFFSIFKAQFKSLIEAVDLIIRQPHHELLEQQEVRNYRQGEYITPKGMKYLSKHPQQLTRVSLREGRTGYIPRQVLKIKKQMSTDVYENQVVKYMLIQMVNRLKHVRTYYMQLRRPQSEDFLSELNQLVGALEQRINGTFFGGISRLERMLQFSIVLQMSPVYQKFYKIYLTLQKGLSLTSDIFQISLKDVAQLYEYWCFIKLGSLLRQHYTLIGTDVIQARQDALFLSLQKGKASTLRFQNPYTGEHLTLVYNQKLGKMPTVSQAPDNMLVLEKELSKIKYHYVLDAKYKMDYGKVNEEVVEVPKEEDINTMHRYRDAIVARHHKENYARQVFGSVILFPGSHEALYTNHRFYKSIEAVNIGGLPFLPSHTKLVEEFLDQLIYGTELAPYEQIPMISGWKTYGKALDLRTKDVLIGPIKNKAQLAGVLKERLYYAPCKSIHLEDKQIKRVALYVPRHLGTAEGEGIIYSGEIINRRTVKRRELITQFPKTDANLDEPYYVFEIKAWHKHKRPIKVKQYGPTRPQYTNQTLLKYARTYPELHIKSPMELELILQLRRRLINLEDKALQGKHMLSYEPKLLASQQDEPSFVAEVGKYELYIQDDTLVVMQEGKPIKTFSPFDLKHKPIAIYNFLMK